MDKIDIQKLRDLPIEGVAERLGLRVKSHKCLCPFHQDHHASMSFSIKRNSYRCFVCGASGSGPIDLVMRYLNKDFVDACHWLADEHNVILTEFKPQTSNLRSALPLGSSKKSQTHFDSSRYERYFEHPWLSQEAQKFLFDERQITPRVAAWCRLASWRDKQGVPWLQIPYYNQQGRLVGVQNRNLIKGATPRFRFPQGSECGIYNLPILNHILPGEALWITEGCSDCWAMLSTGRKAIAIPSATLLSMKDKEKLSIINSQLSISFHMYPDRDEPGERLFMQLREVLPRLEHHQLPAGCKDFGEYYLTLNNKR